MPIFIAGLLLGALSGGGTFAFTGDGGLAVVIGAVSCVLTWLGVATVIFMDGEL